MQDGPDPTSSVPAGKEPRKGIRARTAEIAARAESTRRTAQRQSERLREQYPAARMVFDAYEDDRRHAGPLLAGGLAYRLFLWLLPFSLVVVSLVGLVADVASISPQEVADRSRLALALTDTIAEAADKAGRGSLALLLIGLWLLVWAGKAAVKALRLIAAVAWQIRPSPLRHGFRASLIFSGAMIALLAEPVLVAPLHAGPFIVDLIVWIASTIAAAVLFAWLLSFFPHPDGVGWTAFLPGGALLAIGFQVLRILTAIYFVGRLDRVDDLYGALGTAAVIMVWLFLLGRLMVAAMTLNAARHRTIAGPAPESPAPKTGARSA